jgi:mRNA deadenylase 3'-5' endonuclease subunit Ccr4
MVAQNGPCLNPLSAGAAQKRVSNSLKVRVPSLLMLQNTFILLHIFTNSSDAELNKRRSDLLHKQLQ